MGEVPNSTAPGDAELGIESDDSLTPEPVRRSAKMPDHLLEWIGQDWDPTPPAPHPAAGSGVGVKTLRRRTSLSGHFPGQLLVVASGQARQRANDTEYAFRADSAFAWLTGESVEGAVLVLTPHAGDSGHDSTLFVREYQQPGSEGYFTDYTHGAIWVGNVATPQETAETLGISTRPLSELARFLEPWRAQECALLSASDPLLSALLPNGAGEILGRVIDELRLAKDDWEIERLQEACDATTRGFEDVVHEIPKVLDRPLRGERWLEGTFWRRARLEGNEVGYTSIIGGGQHATTLHWWRNHGRLQSGELLLADMGVESNSLYTADVTRTLPLNGDWTPIQRQIYSAVLEAQSVGIAECRVGNDFLAAGRASMQVLAQYLHFWGILDVAPEVSTSRDPETLGAGRHRRWTLHGVSHALGLDVHDCAQASDEVYTQGKLAMNHVLTVEPGLYFQANDLRVPKEFRGIGIRIEDDILVTESGPLNMSAALPRDPEEISRWMTEIQARTSG